MDPKTRVFDFVKKYWYVAILLAIFVSAFWVRSFPARFNELQAIDPFYIYRMSEYVINNDFQLPEIDMMRHHPFGVDPKTQTPVPFFLPAYMYVFIGPLTGLEYFPYALLYPAIMGAVAVVVMFFIGKEIYDVKTGLLAAFFLATVPAFITRTSAGFFDKEASAGVFMLMAFYFFLRAYKRSDWKSGIASGLSMFMVIETWAGGLQYVLLLVSLFTFIMLILNINIKKITVAYVPFAVFSIVPMMFTYYQLPLTSFYAMVPLFLAAVILLRNAVEKYGWIKREYVPYFVPGLIVLAFVGILVTSMFTGFGSQYITELTSKLSLWRSTELSTVAESNPGNWNVITGATTVSYGMRIIPQLSYGSALLSMNVFMILGALLIVYMIAYRLYKKQDYRKQDFLLLFALIWLLSAVWSVFGYIRLLFFVGPPVALVSGIFISKLIDLCRKTKIMENAGTLREKINYVSVPLTVFISLVLIANFANAYVYGMSMGPSINSYWKESMDFLSTETPENSNILSWWDFGYWFQTRGHRPTLTDGGFGKRLDVATWFTADSNNWTDFEPWLMDTYGIDYILMDYSLPGKYGAISTIATHGERPVGMLQFEQSQVYPEDGRIIVELRSGQYALWLPMNDAGNAMVGAPMLLVMQNGQYYSKAYINEICTTDGIKTISSEGQSIGGCVAMTSFGVFYVPPEAYNTIFSNLMFMEGHGFPVEKVFDNQVIKIFKVIYDENDDNTFEPNILQESIF